ncbi:hypothetical protein QE152_g22710 [Popillia japonica]|uniref:Uncharacterized protein n=1 Tax=Popillia japonica TaxID=7064 RepID=A0AAW1KJJ6_POPJA
MVKYSDSMDNCDDLLDITEDNNFFKWATKIEQSCKGNIKEGNRDNAQYLEELVLPLKKLITYLPLWSNVMHRYFLGACTYPNSASVESNFKTLKKCFFSDTQLPMRLDRFIFDHIKHLDGSIKLASALNATVIKKEPELQERDEVENWRNQVNPKRRKHHSYLSSQPEWSALNLNESLNTIGLLRNGNSLQLRPVQVNNTSTILSNTCGFDSLVPLIPSYQCD